MHRYPGVGERRDVLVRYVLVVEGHNVAAARERAQVVQGALDADHDVGRDQRRAVVGRFGENSHRLSQRDRRLMSHPRQLARSDHADDRQFGAGIHVARG